MAFMRGEYQVPIANSVEALEISRSIDNIWGQWSAASSPSFTYMELGEFGKSIEATKLADSLSREGGLVLQQSFGYRMLAWTYAYLGAVDLGTQYYLEARDTELEEVPPPLRSWMAALLGMFEIAIGDLRSAERNIEETQTALDFNDFTYPAPAFALLARGELALAQGAWDRAIIESDEMIARFLRARGPARSFPMRSISKGRRYSPGARKKKPEIAWSRPATWRNKSARAAATGGS